MQHAFLLASHERHMAPVFQLASACERGTDRIEGGADGNAKYLAWCLDMARRYAIDVFVAQRARIFLARHVDAFAAIGTRLVVAADGDTLEAIEDKGRFYQRCAAAGLPTPLARPFATADAFDAAHRAIVDAGHEVCVKPTHGVFGAGYFRLVDDMPLFRTLMRIDDRIIDRRVFRSALQHVGDMPEMLAMQHLPGLEWSVDCVCENGKILAGVARSKHGHSQLIEADGPAMDVARQVARLFGLSNLVNIQLKSASIAEAIPHVLEVNTRMSGGCAYADLAGLNLPLIQAQLAGGVLDRSRLPRPRRVTGASIDKVIDITDLEPAMGAAVAADA